MYQLRERKNKRAERAKSKENKNELINIKNMDGNNKIAKNQKLNKHPLKHNQKPSNKLNIA
jgi:hypothetical protein